MGNVREAIIIAKMVKGNGVYAKCEMAFRECG